MEKTTDMTDFDRLLLAAKEIRGWSSPSQIAAELTKSGYSVSDQIMTNWKKRGVSKEGKIKASAIIGCRTQWVEDGSGEMRDLHAALGPSIQTPMRPVRSIDNPDEIEHDILTVPRYTIQPSMGSGSPVMEVDVEGEPNYMRRSWARRRNLKVENLFTVVAIGDSMEPEIQGGASVTINKQENLVNDKMMMVCYRDQCYIKRILIQGDGSLILRSENRDKYKDTVIDHEGINELHVVGLVVNISHDVL